MFFSTISLASCLTFKNELPQPKGIRYQAEEKLIFNFVKTCIIIEDQPPAQRILKRYIANFGKLELKGTFSDAIEALTFLQNNIIDLIFLDIHLPKISGMEFLKTLKNSPQIILTTAFSEYALESYQHNVVDYLLKPFSFQRFVQAVTKSTINVLTTVAKEKTATFDDSLFIKLGYDFIKINQKDILYIKSDSDYCEIVTIRKKILSSDSLKEWLQKLSADFCQIHKSYIVNTKLMQKISGNRIYLTNDSFIPLGRAYKKYFIKKYLKQ